MIEESKHYALAIVCGAKRGPKDSDLTFSPASLRDFLKALEQPQQEPVAWMWQHDETGRIGFVDPWQVENGWQENNPRCRLITPLYAAPPRREWVGLTDDERDSFWRADQMTGEEWRELFDAIEAKLREKNT